MSSSEEEQEVIIIPKHRVRFTDMPPNLVDKAVIRKSKTYYTQLT